MDGSARGPGGSGRPGEFDSRVALIGGGRWAEVHRDALRSLGLEPAAVLVSREESAQRLRDEWGVPAETELGRFLAVPSDAVIVASPNHLHAAHAQAAVGAGRHVLVEKPMSLRVEECRDLIRTAQEAGVVLAVGHEMRVFTLFEQVRQVIESGDVGAPVHLKLDLWRRPYRSGVGGWKADPEKLGSTILEEPIHYLDLARWYLGPVADVQAWANSRSGREGMWENLEVKLEHESGARSWVTRSIAGFGHSVTLMLVGEQGSLRGSWRGAMDMDRSPEVRLELQRAGNETEVVAISQATGHAFDLPRQTRAFLAAISGSGEPAASGEDGCAAVDLCLAVERSLRGG